MLLPLRAQMFLAQLEARGKEAGAVEAWEWDLVRVVAASGTLSMTSNPSLLAAAARAHRYAFNTLFVSAFAQHARVSVLYIVKN
jgi:hypothetical protein